MTKPKGYMAPSPHALARAHRLRGTAATEAALQAAIATAFEGVWRLPDDSTTRSLPKALGAWLHAVAPTKGRPPGSARPGHAVTLKLSLAARARLNAVPRPERGRWVSALIERA